MILKMFTVYDSKAEAYLPPFFLRSTGEAVRSYEHVCNDPNHAFFKHPADYTLFCVGEFDDNSCSINVLQAIENLGCAIEYKNSPIIQREGFPPEEYEYETPIPTNSTGAKVDG